MTRSAAGNGALMASRLSPVPAPFIVGAPRSGTTLLRMMIDAHPAIAIPPETNFFFFSPGARVPTTGAEFLQTVTAAPNWADFHLDCAGLREALDSQEPFDLADALRIFYRLYAARFGKR